MAFLFPQFKMYKLFFLLSKIAVHCNSPQMKWIDCPSNAICDECLKVSFQTGDDVACVNQKWSENNCAFEGSFMNGGTRVFVSSQQCLIDGKMEIIQVKQG